MDPISCLKNAHIVTLLSLVGLVAAAHPLPRQCG